MPLTVDIKINGKPIETIWIGRMEALKGPLQTHQYLVRDQHGASATFSHNYSAGAQECVRRALNALEGKQCD